MQSSITVLIPAYNEEKVIKKTVLDLFNYLSPLKRKKKIGSFEIIICINASRDKTEEIAKRLSKKYKEIKYLSIRERGLGIALKKGIEKSSKDIIVSFIPADGEVLNEFIERAILALKECDFVNGSRYLVKSQIRGSSVRRRLLSIGFAFLVHNFFSKDLSEVGAVKVFKRKWAQKIIKKCKRDDASWQMEILYYALRDNLKIKEIPIKIEIKRKSSESKIRIARESLSFLKTTLYFWLALRFYEIKKLLGFKS